MVTWNPKPKEYYISEDLLEPIKELWAMDVGTTPGFYPMQMILKPKFAVKQFIQFLELRGI